MKKKITFQQMVIAAVLIIVAGNTFFIGRLTSMMSVNLSKAFELSRPAKLSAVIIKPADCESCFDINTAYEKIKSGNVSIESEETLDMNSGKAKELIAKYGIEKLPTIILTGEIKRDAQIEKAWKAVGEIKDDAVVFTALLPPFFDTDLGRTVGEVEVTYLNDKQCPGCYTYEAFIGQLKQTGVTVTKENSMDYRTPEAQRMIRKYGIKQVPAFILNSEIGQYENIAKKWSQFGRVADDGSYLMNKANAPYRELSDGRIRGLVNAVNLVDPDCAECLSPNSFKQIFARYGLKYNKEETVNINSEKGLALLDKYGIKKVPAAILSSEIEAYPSLIQVWNQIGTNEKDGSYVIRNLSIVQGGKYMDLTTNTLSSN